VIAYFHSPGEIIKIIDQDFDMKDEELIRPSAIRESVYNFLGYESNSS
jgi:hypothetical protein